MKLGYPNGRLLIINLLHNDDIGCSEALFRGACSLGLIAKDSIVAHGNGQGCASLETTKQIVECYFDQKHKTCSASTRAQMKSQVISDIEKDVEAYKAMTGLVHPKTEKRDPLDCGNMAPVVFDFLLQHIRRYD